MLLHIFKTLHRRAPQLGRRSWSRRVSTTVRTPVKEKKDYTVPIFFSVVGAMAGEAVALCNDADSVPEHAMYAVGGAIFPVSLPLLAALHLTGLDQSVPGLRKKSVEDVDCDTCPI